MLIGLLYLTLMKQGKRGDSDDVDAIRLSPLVPVHPPAVKFLSHLMPFIHTPITENSMDNILISVMMKRKSFI
jgi:hypothetical protein